MRASNPEKEHAVHSLNIIKKTRTGGAGGYTGRIIDLRDAGAFCCGHIYGAENYPFHELMQNPSVLTAQEPLLFYCTRGSESLLACNYYARQGYQVYNVANGLSYYCGKYLTL